MCEAMKKSTLHPQAKQDKPEENQVIVELRAKLHRLRYRLFEYQEHNQDLQKELTKLKMLYGKFEFEEKVIEHTPDEFLPLAEQLKNVEEVKVLKSKVHELQSRIRELESNDREERLRARARNRDILPPPRRTSRERELFEACTKLKRKIECLISRNLELKQESARLKLEADRLEEKGKENQNIQSIYSSVEKRLQGVQSEKLLLRGKLGVANTKNQQLVDERNALKDDIEKMRSKINDDDMLIEVLASQQKTFQDLISREQMHDREEHRNYQCLLNDIHASFETALDMMNNVREAMWQDNAMEHVIVDNTPLLIYVRGPLEVDEKSTSDVASTTTDALTTTTGETEETGAESEVSVGGSSPAVEPPPEEPEEDLQVMISAIEKFWAQLQSTIEEVDNFSHTVSSNHDKIDDWVGQYIQLMIDNFRWTNEVRDLEYTLERLQNSLEGTKPQKVLRDNAFEKDTLLAVQKILLEERNFLKVLSCVSMEAKKAYINTYDIAIDRMAKLFVDYLRNQFIEVLQTPEAPLQALETASSASSS